MEHLAAVIILRNRPERNGTVPAHYFTERTLYSSVSHYHLTLVVNTLRDAVSASSVSNFHFRASLLIESTDSMIKTSLCILHTDLVYVRSFSISLNRGLLRIEAGPFRGWGLIVYFSK